MEKINTNYIIETLNCLDKTYGFVEVKQNFTYHEKEHWKRVNLCDDVSQLPSQVVVAQLLKKIVTNHSFYN